MDRSLLLGRAPEVAPLLLGTVLRHGGRSARIVEVEAYTDDDPASHSFRGPTARNRSMFGEPGLLYVYFTYGMHWCANVVCGPPGTGDAVLLRAGQPLTGTAEMAAARSAGRADARSSVSPVARINGGVRRGIDAEVALCNGPAKLCQALGIDRRHDGADLFGPAGTDGDLGPQLFDDGLPPPAVVCASSRIGIRLGTDRLWRFSIPNCPYVSRKWSGA